MAERIVPTENPNQDVVGGGPTNPSGYTPTDAERKAIKLVLKLFDKAKKHKSKYDEKWLDYYKMFRGRQWKEQRPSYRHSEVVNMIFQNIQSSVPILTDSQPRFEFLPTEPSDLAFAKILNDLISVDWVQNNWQTELVESVYDAYFYGAGFGSMGYDPNIKNGIGGIKHRSEDPFYVFPDPNARDVNKEASSFIFAEPIDVEILKAEYPDLADFIKPDLQDLMKGDKTDLTQVKYKSPVDSRAVIEGTSAYDARDNNKALKITLWLKSKEFEEKEEQLENAQGELEVKYVQQLKYPKGRKICIASGVLLDDCEFEYDDGKFPFARLINYTLPREFWGISDIEQLAGPQKIFNKLISFSLDVLTLMGNPIWIVDTDSGIDTENLINRPGLIVEKEKGTEVRREAGVQLQPYVLQLIDRMKSWFDDISGNNEVSRGVNPTGVSAASAIEALQQAAQQRLRLKARHIDAYLQDIGQMYVSRVLQYKTVPEIYRITNDQNASKYFKFHVERPTDETGNPVLDDKGDPVTVAKYREFSEDLNGNPVLGEEQQIQIRGRFDVRVVTGSSLPFMKAQKEQQAFQLFDRGAIDIEELLKAVEYPNWEAVFQRVQQKQAEQAQQAQMAAPKG